MTQETQVELDQEEAAFQAELANETEDVSAPLVNEKKTAEDNVSVDVKPEDAKLERIEVIPGYTKEELDAVLTEVPKLRSALEKTNGTYGSRLAEQQRIIDELKARAEQPKQAQDAVKLKQIKLNRLKEHYPDFAEMLAEDLSEEVVSQESNFDPSVIETTISRRLDEERQAREAEVVQREIRLLKREHPDFETIARYARNDNGLIQWDNPAFGNWVVAQPKEIQDVVINSSDAYAISDVLTDYKNSLKKKKTTNDLENAVQPRGLPSNRSVDHLDDEERAFQEELAKEEY